MQPEKPSQELKPDLDDSSRGEPEGRSGGVNFQGPVTAPNAKFAGRDLYNVETHGLSPQDLDELFTPVIKAIQQAPPEKQAQAQETAKELKSELAKGEKAEDSRIAKLVDNLLNLVPGALSAVATLFGQPILAGLVGPVTKFVLDQFGLQS